MRVDIIYSLRSGVPKHFFFKHSNYIIMFCVLNFNNYYIVLYMGRVYMCNISWCSVLEQWDIFFSSKYRKNLPIAIFFF